MNTRVGHTLGWIAVAALLVLGPAPLRRGPHVERRPGVLVRLLGPIPSLAAGVQWVRFDLALRDGRPELAYAYAGSALALDPRSPGGWLTLARHLVFERGSPSAEPLPAERRRWIRAGLAQLERGEASARTPALLAFVRGTILAEFVAEIPDEELGWPGGRRAALEEARGAFERAAALGDPRGGEYAELVGQELERP